MDKLKKAIEELGYPSGDLHDHPASPLTFADGAHYRIEISGQERLSNLEAMADEADKRGVPVHRVILMVGGPGNLPFGELRDMAQLCLEKKYEAMVNCSAVRGWDTGRFPATSEGIWAGFSVRGADSAYHQLKDIERVLNAGFRGILLFDPGMLGLVADLRAKGVFPKEMTIKASVLVGCGTPAWAKTLIDMGADTINPVADITVPQLAAIRRTVKCPLDVYMTIVDSMGGMHRYHEASELVRCGAPVYFKIEPGVNEISIYKTWTESSYQDFLCRQKIKQAQATIEWVRHMGGEDLKVSGPGPADLTLPRL